MTRESMSFYRILLCTVHGLVIPAVSTNAQFVWANDNIIACGELDSNSYHRPVKKSSQRIAVSSIPVTFSQWDCCVADGGCNGYTPDRQGWARDAPVVNVNYDDAQSYVKWLSKKSGYRHRLVRESEWAEFALGGATTKYPWGNHVGKANTNCLDCGSRWDGKSANPVRSFKPNRLRLYDVVGNVAHWTEADSAESSRGASACKEKRDYAAIFGASWADPSKFLGVNEWACFPKVLRDDTIGFRVVRELYPKTLNNRRVKQRERRIVGVEPRSDADR
jgi:formylglycine-generating enzyme required for sulfatase activity